MKSRLIFLIPAAIVIAFGVGYFWLNQGSINPGGSCQSLYSEIDGDIKKANYCETDADCSTLILGGDYIKFGCYHFVNKDVDKQRFYDKMQGYVSQGCSDIINECAFEPEAKCVEKKCVVSDA